MKVVYLKSSCTGFFNIVYSTWSGVFGQFFVNSPMADFIKILSGFLGYSHAYGKMEEYRVFNKWSAWMYVLLRAVVHLPSRVRRSIRNWSILKRVLCECKRKGKSSPCNLPWKFREGVDSCTLSSTTTLEWDIKIFFIFKFRNKFVPNIIVAVQIILNYEQLGHSGIQSGGLIVASETGPPTPPPPLPQPLDVASPRVSSY